MRKRIFKEKINIWMILSSIFVVFILLPNIHIITGVFAKNTDSWNHIKEFLLRDYIVNSTIIVIFTGIFTTLIGVSLSWLMSVYDFPYRKFLRGALVLPLAIPPYIAAYTYHGIFNYTGVVQSTLRNVFGVKVAPGMFDVMSIKGSIFIFTFMLFPYVYIITRSFLEKQSSSLIENARILGRGSFDIFFHIALPVSRVAIVGGLTLVSLEVLSDYGVVSYYGIPTFSTAIFTAWFSMGDLAAAIKLAGILMISVFGILSIEKVLRGRKKYSFTNSKINPVKLQKLTGVKSLLASAYGFIIFGFGFVIPTMQMVHWAITSYDNVSYKEFTKVIFNTVSVSLISATIVIIIGLIIASNVRVNKGKISKLYAKISVIGYSIPGAVIAIGVISFFVKLDRSLYPLYKMINPNSSKLVLSMSIVMLISAYVIRYLAIGFNSIDSGYEKIGVKFNEASRTLGYSSIKTFFKVDMIILKPAIISAFVLVFVDILKELPLTLILRPFNFETLASTTYRYAGDEMIKEASIPSLVIIGISILSIIVFNILGQRKENN